MAFHSRRLLPETQPAYSSPSPSPAPSPSPSDRITCLPCDPTCPYPTNCPWPYASPPPPPPSFPLPPPSSSSPARSPLLSTPGILAVSVVSSLFLLTIYFILLARHRRSNARGPDRGPPPPPPPGDFGRWVDGEEWNQNLAMVHPIWLINTVGLQPDVISSIAVCQYRKGEGLIEGGYCSICLSEFEEGENLRLLPKCSHAFHIPCIDTWLRSHTNCPLCRAPILAPLPVSGSLAVHEPTGSRSGSLMGEDARENAEGGGTARADMGDSRSGEEELNEKPRAEEAEAGASVGRRSVSMDSIAITVGVVNLDREGNEMGRTGGVRSLPGSRRFPRSGSR